MSRIVITVTLILSLVAASATTASARRAGPPVGVTVIGVDGVRPIHEIRRDIHQVLRAIAMNTRTALGLANRKQSRQTHRDLIQMQQRIKRASDRLQHLEGELDVALANSLAQVVVVTAPPLPEPEPMIVVEAPPVVEDPGPTPMTPSEFSKLVQRMKSNAFDDARIQALDDSIHAGAFFTRAQGVSLIKLVTFSRNQVTVGAKVCQRMLEGGALPEMIDSLTFRSTQQELRDRTGNRCEWDGNM